MQQQHGFQAILKGIKVITLAQEVWNIAQNYLTTEELALLAGEIERIIEARSGPAEDQVRLLREQAQRNTGESSWSDLIHLLMMTA